MEEPKSLQEAIVYFSDEERCIRYLAAKRWPDGVVVCPVCGREGASYVASRRVWQCKTRHPRCQFSIKVGTIFEDSPIPLGKWLAAMWMIANCKNGISSWEIHRALKVTQKTAWFMLHRVRLAMRNKAHHKMAGPVEVDESYIGGNPKNRHRGMRPNDIRKRMEECGVKTKSTAGRGTEKTAVFGLLDRETRHVRAHVIPGVRREVLMNSILINAEKGSKVYSDGLPEYKSLKALDFVHEAVDHINEYVRGDVHTNGIENFWSLFKRTLKGTYVAVEPFHLDRYADEQTFRFNNRATPDNPLNDSDRFTLAVLQILDRRLTYAELTGKADARPF